MLAMLFYVLASLFYPKLSTFSMIIDLAVLTPPPLPAFYPRQIYELGIILLEDSMYLHPSLPSPFIYRETWFIRDLCKERSFITVNCVLTRHARMTVVK